jgi:hypothetical protein
VLEGGDEGANQSLEGSKANLASEGKPQIINPSFKFMQLPLLCLCIYVSGVDLKP